MLDLDAAPSKPFSPLELRLLDYCEQVWHITGRLPSADKAATAVRGLDAKTFKRMMADPRIMAHLSAERGITVDEPSESLTAEQLVLANTLLDLSDKRTERQKLQALGIPSAKYTAWKRDPGFAAYMRERAELALGDALPDIHMALIDTAKRGDISGIKLAYEITGRFNSKSANEVNIELLLLKIIEILQRHVDNPVILQNIAGDLSLLAPSVVAATTTPTPVAKALPAAAIESGF